MAKPTTPKKLENPFAPSWQHTSWQYVAGRAAIDAADLLAVAMEAKWGAGRLRLLVDTETREKFDRQRLKLNNAIHYGNLKQVQTEAQRMVNAWNYLDQAATQAGAAELSALVWEIALSDGRVLALVRHPHEVKHVITEGRHVDVCTVHEVANLYEGFPMLVKVKQTFKGAEVVKVHPVRDPLENWEEGDSLPDPLLPPTAA